MLDRYVRQCDFPGHSKKYEVGLKLEGGEVGKRRGWGVQAPAEDAEYLQHKTVTNKQVGHKKKETKKVHLAQKMDFAEERNNAITTQEWRLHRKAE